MKNTNRHQNNNKEKLKRKKILSERTKYLEKKKRACKLYEYMFLLQVVQTELIPPIHTPQLFFDRFILRHLFYCFTFRLSGSSERPA